MKRYAVPSDPQTSAQLGKRQLFRTIGAAYRSLSGQDVAAWYRSTAGQPLTAYNLFIRAHFSTEAETDGLSYVRGMALVELTDGAALLAFFASAASTVAIHYGPSPRQLTRATAAAPCGPGLVLAEVPRGVPGTQLYFRLQSPAGILPAITSGVYELGDLPAAEIDTADTWGWGATTQIGWGDNAIMGV